MKSFIRKLTAFAVILTIGTSAMSVNASASTQTPSDEVILATMDACYADKDLIDYLNDNNVAVDADDEISVIVTNDSSERSTGVMQMRILKDNGNEHEVTVLSGYDLDDTGTLTAADVPVDVSAPTSRSTKTISISNSTNSFTANITVSYTSTSSGIYTYFKPSYVQFSYSKIGTGKTVTKAELEMQSEGSLCDSSFTELGNYEYQNVATINRSNPVKNDIYYGFANFPSNRYLMFTGQIDSGIYVSYDFTFNDEAYPACANRIRFFP